MDSEWYQDRNAPSPSGSEPSDPKERAAWLSAQHANTPSTVHLDSLGRPFLSVAHNVTGTGAGAVHAYYKTRTLLDIEGNTLGIYDAKQFETTSPTNLTLVASPYKTIEQKFDVLQRRLRTVSPDAGTRLAVQDIAGRPLRSWNSRGFTMRMRFDAAHRPIESLVKLGTSETVVARMSYGEALDSPSSASPSPAQLLNLRGQVHLAFDTAGLVKTEEVDFKGNVLKASRRLANVYKTTPDWSTLSGTTDPATLEANAGSFLESETFTTETEYDALNRVVSATSPASQTSGVPFSPSVTRPVYNEANLLDSVHVQVRGGIESDVINNLEYNARGQRLTCDHANPTTGATSHSIAYTYDPETFRLTRLVTTRSSDSVVLQDLRYFFDAVGNITEVQDHADTSPVFSGTTPVTGTGYYRYDALYRLTYAEGREHPGQQPSADDPPRGSVPHPNDLQALQRYDEDYTYDEVGNIDSVVHHVGGAGWTRLYGYDAASNRLLKTYGPSDSPGTIASIPYDSHGSMTQMPHLSTMEWDFADRLQHTERSGGSGQHTYFTYGASGERVRKVYVHGTTIEERIYLGGIEIYRKRSGAANEPLAASIEVERETLHVMDDTRRVAMVETLTVNDGSAPGTVEVPRWRFQLGNHLDSASMELDESAGVLSYEEYHPYGSTAFHSAKAGAEVSAKRYRYTGKEKDDETGLYYHGARYYAPWLGRWTAADPAGLIDGLNLYRYSRDNPVNFNDPGGTKSGGYDQQHVDVQLQVDHETGAVAFSASYEFANSETGDRVGGSYSGGADALGAFASDLATGEGIGAHLSQQQREALLEGVNASYVAAQDAAPIRGEGDVRHAPPEEPPQEEPPAEDSATEDTQEDADTEAALDAIQLGLDLAGFAPGPLGIAADLVNAGISAARGNYGEAALNVAAAVPGIGDAIKASAKATELAAKSGDKLLDAVDAAKAAGAGGEGLITRTSKKTATEKGTEASGKAAAVAAQNLRKMGLEGVDLAGKSFNSGRKALEKAGFVLERTTSTGRKVFVNPKTGATVTYDSGRALAPGQKPHWTIQDKGGIYYDRSGRRVKGVSPIMGGRHIRGKR